MGHTVDHGVEATGCDRPMSGGLKVWSAEASGSDGTAPEVAGKSRTSSELLAGVCAANVYGRARCVLGCVRFVARRSGLRSVHVVTER